MVARIAKAAGIPRHISPHSLRHAAITNALDAGVPLRDAQILARHADPRTTEHYDRARGNLDRHGVHFLTAYVAGVDARPSRDDSAQMAARRRGIPSGLYCPDMATTTSKSATRFTTSADGTRIAYQVDGTGSPLVLVDGGLAYREQGLSPGLRKILQDRFAVYSYDRRNRGESDPGATPHCVEREVEDLVAVIETSGAPADVFAHSAGAALALEAARSGSSVLRMVLYEAPFILDSSHPADDPTLPGTSKSSSTTGAAVRLWACSSD